MGQMKSFNINLLYVTLRLALWGMTRNMTPVRLSPTGARQPKLSMAKPISSAAWRLRA